MKNRFLMLLSIFLCVSIAQLESSLSPVSIAGFDYSSPVAKPSLISNSFKVSTPIPRIQEPLTLSLQQFHEAMLSDDVERLDFIFKSSSARLAATLPGVKMPKVALEAKAFLNQPMLNLQGQMEMPLSIALKSRNLKMMEILVGAGANPNIKVNSQDAPLLFGAMQLDDAQAVDLLLIGGADPTVTNKQGKTFLHVAVELGNIDILTSLVTDLKHRNKLSLLNAQTTQGDTPLHTAAKNDNLSAMQLLIDAGANLNLQDKNGNTPLLLSIKNDQPSMVQDLLVHGADVTIPDSNGKTPEQTSVDLKFDDIEVMIKNNIALEGYNKSVHKQNLEPVLAKLKSPPVSDENQNLQSAVQVEETSELFDKNKNAKSAVESVQVSKTPELESQLLRLPTIAPISKAATTTELQNDFNKVIDNIELTKIYTKSAVESLKAPEAQDYIKQARNLSNPLTETDVVVYRSKPQPLQNRYNKYRGVTSMAVKNALQKPMQSPQQNNVASQNELPIILDSTPALNPEPVVGSETFDWAENIKLPAPVAKATKPITFEATNADSVLAAKQMADIAKAQAKMALDSRAKMVDAFEASAKAQQFKAKAAALQSSKSSSVPRIK